MSGNVINFSIRELEIRIKVVWFGKLWGSKVWRVDVSCVLFCFREEGRRVGRGGLLCGWRFFWMCGEE